MYQVLTQAADTLAEKNKQWFVCCRNTQDVLCIV